MPEQATPPVVGKIEIELLADGNVACRAAKVSIQNVLAMCEIAKYNLVQALAEQQRSRVELPKGLFDPKHLRA